jgi:hypothetical protein
LETEDDIMVRLCLLLSGCLLVLALAGCGREDGTGEQGVQGPQDPMPAEPPAVMQAIEDLRLELGDPPPPELLAGGNCCLAAGSSGSNAFCTPQGTKCCTAITALQCGSVGGNYYSTAAACAAAAATCP